MVNNQAHSSIFDNCDDSCGWVAAIVACVAYGSWGVPIKATVDIDVHPLVLQSFKTLTLFLTSWAVLLMGVNVSITYWGLLSGFLWVLGGTGGIYAIRMAGLALAVGIWASVIMCVNFIWGILIFNEPVANVWGTLCAFFLLAVGLVGMSHFASSNSDDHRDDEVHDMLSSHSNTLIGHPEALLSTKKLVDNELRHDRVEAGYAQHLSDANTAYAIMRTTGDVEQTELVNLFGLTLTKRNAGILGAVFNGVMTGSSFIPLHYAAQQGYGGAFYMISFAGGASVANVLFWVAFFTYNFMNSLRENLPGSKLLQAYNSMPSWHLKELWIPGFTAGIILSIAMFGSILATTYLGQGIGNSVVQSKILISGLWGIFWFNEIRGWETVFKWFGAASLSILGILWLIQERLAATKH